MLDRDLASKFSPDFGQVCRVLGASLSIGVGPVGKILIVDDQTQAAWKTSFYNIFTRILYLWEPFTIIVILNSKKIQTTSVFFHSKRIFFIDLLFVKISSLVQNLMVKDCF